MELDVVPELVDAQLVAGDRAPVRPVDRPQDVRRVPVQHADPPERLEQRPIVGGDAGRGGRHRPDEREPPVRSRNDRRRGTQTEPASDRRRTPAETRARHPSNCSTISGQAGTRSSTTSRPAAPHRAARSRSSHSRSKASATASGSGATTSPVSWSVMNSSAPPLSESVTTGLAAANASRGTYPKSSSN